MENYMQDEQEQSVDDKYRDLLAPTELSEESAPADDFNLEAEVETPEAINTPNVDDVDVHDPEAQERSIIEMELAKREAAKQKEAEGYIAVGGTCDSGYASAEEIADILVDTISDMGTRASGKALRDPESYLSRILRLTKSPATSIQAVFANEGLKHLKELKRELVQAVGELKDGVSHGGGYHDNLSGDVAAVAFRARAQGVVKLHLYNSGFNMVLRPFTMDELNTFFLACDQSAKELGRILGGHFYMINDMYIKKRFMELLPLAIVSSNLKGYAKKETLLKAISLQDYDTIIATICSMMYTKGIQKDIICTNKKCQHIEKDVVCDLAKARILNNVSDEMIMYTRASTKRSLKDLATYVKDVVVCDNDSFTYDSIKFDLRVPSMYDYFEYAEDIMSRISARTMGEKSIANKVVMSNLIVQYYKAYVPWLKRVSQLNADGSVAFSSDGIEAFNAIMDNLGTVDADTEVIDKISNFIHETKTSYITYATSTCPECKAEASDAVDGLRIWDVQYLFFYLTYRTLGSIGAI